MTLPSSEGDVQRSTKAAAGIPSLMILNAVDGFLQVIGTSTACDFEAQRTHLDEKSRQSKAR